MVVMVVQAAEDGNGGNSYNAELLNIYQSPITITNNTLDYVIASENGGTAGPPGTGGSGGIGGSWNIQPGHQVGKFNTHSSSQ